MMPNKYEGSGKLAAIIAERDALKADMEAMRSNAVAKLCEALRAWLERYPICHTTISAGWQTITPEMENRRCNACLPCRTRQALKEIGNE